MFGKIALFVLIALKCISASPIGEDIDAILAAANRALVDYQEISTSYIKYADEKFQLSLTANEEAAACAKAVSSKVIDEIIDLRAKDIEMLENVASNIDVDISNCSTNARNNLKVLVNSLNLNLDLCTGNIINQSEKVVRKIMDDFKQMADRDLVKSKAKVEECLGLEEGKYNCLDGAVNSIQHSVHYYPDYVIKSVKETQELLVLLTNSMELCQIHAGNQSEDLSVKIIREVVKCLSNQIPGLKYLKIN